MKDKDAQKITDTTAETLSLHDNPWNPVDWDKAHSSNKTGF